MIDREKREESPDVTSDWTCGFEDSDEMMIVGRFAHSHRSTGTALEKQQPLDGQKTLNEINETTRNECCEDIVVVGYIDCRIDDSNRSSSKKLSSYRYCGEDGRRCISV